MPRKFCPGLSFENVREKTLGMDLAGVLVIPVASAGKTGCRSPAAACDRRTEDFGGCRCQAFLLAGDANVTDPACSLAPSHIISSNPPCARRMQAAAIAQPVSASSFVQLQRQNAGFLELPHESRVGASQIPELRLQIVQSSTFLCLAIWNLQLQIRDHFIHQRTPTVIGRKSVVMPPCEPCMKRNSA